MGALRRIRRAGATSVSQGRSGIYEIGPMEIVDVQLLVNRSSDCTNSFKKKARRRSYEPLSAGVIDEERKDLERPWYSCLTWTYAFQTESRG